MNKRIGEGHHPEDEHERMLEQLDCLKPSLITFAIGGGFLRRGMWEKEAKTGEK